MTFTTGDPNGTYPSTSVRNHPFEGGVELFDDDIPIDGIVYNGETVYSRADIEAMDPWPTTAAAVKALREGRIAQHAPAVENEDGKLGS